MSKVLLVEDDLHIQEFVQELLVKHGYTVFSHFDGISALAFLKEAAVDLVLLDLSLPQLAGETVCVEIRKKYSHLPIIILTAKDTTSDIVNGFALGADDYITKPFVADVLLARLKARLRTGETLLTIADLKLNTQTIEVTRGDKKIELSPYEFKLLHHLLSNKGRVLSRQMILNHVWQHTYEVDTRVVDVYIGYLRKKIDAGFSNKLIHSVRGFGYVIKETQ